MVRAVAVGGISCKLGRDEVVAMGLLGGRSRNETLRWPFGIPHPLEPPAELHENFLVVRQLPEKNLHHAVEALGHVVIGAR